MAVEIVVVNASGALSDADAAAIVPALQVWDDTMVAPAWGFDKCTYSFITFNELRAGALDNIGADVWPLFLNRHSTDPGALGWHTDQTGMVFGRVFVGDCLLYGLSWTVDASHEAAEMRGDPTINKTWVMPDGRQALMELCDPVEDEILGIDVNGVKLSDFVLPSYFSAQFNPPFDYKGRLTAPCPTLAPGGYQSIYDGVSWTQVTSMLMGGPPSYRSIRWHHGHRLPRPVP
jgi:hypothetical protein